MSMEKDIDNSNRIRLTVVWPAYRNDSELLLESLRTARIAFSKLPRIDPSFVMLDDAWCTVDLAAREKFLEAPHASRIVTVYRRGPMILGGENLLGQCEAFLKAAEETDADILVKMDCDTQLFNADWLQAFADNPSAMIGGAFEFGMNNPISIYGGCYALKRSILQRLMFDCRKYPAHHAAWEDYEVSMRVYRICGGDEDSLMRWRAGLDDLFLSIPLSQANDTLIGARWVSLGWDYSSQPPEKKPEYKRNMLEWMRRLNDKYESSNNASEKSKEAPPKEAEAKDKEESCQK